MELRQDDKGGVLSLKGFARANSTTTGSFPHSKCRPFLLTRGNLVQSLNEILNQVQDDKGGVWQDDKGGFRQDDRFKCTQDDKGGVYQDGTNDNECGVLITDWILCQGFGIERHLYINIWQRLPQMRITSPVKALLSRYESTPSGVKANLARMLMHGALAGTGKLVILLADQRNAISTNGDLSAKDTIA